MKNTLLSIWNFYLEGFRDARSYFMDYYPAEIIRHVLHSQIVLFSGFPW